MNEVVLPETGTPYKKMVLTTREDGSLMVFTHFIRWIPLTNGDHKPVTSLAELFQGTPVDRERFESFLLYPDFLESMTREEIRDYLHGRPLTIIEVRFALDCSLELPALAP